MTSEEKFYLDSLITNALTINSDEMEGQQVIDLNNLNLCAVDYAKSDVIADEDNQSDSKTTEYDFLKNIYEDKDLIKLITTPAEDLPDILKDINTDNRVIIEFAGATVKDPNPVTYSIKVKPGDTITDDTIIGDVMQNGKLKTIKSIFSKGTVSSINNGEDYFRLYPSNCDRHIVLENTLSGSGQDFDIYEDIMSINEKFQHEGLLYALITNNMCYSLLPYVLSHRYRGVYTRKRSVLSEGKWYLDTSDLSYDNTEVSTFITNKAFKDNKQYDTTVFVFDNVNESLDTGVAIFDSSIIQVLDDIQDEFGAKIISPDITKNDMKSWKKRAKKKKKRKKVKKEINEKTQQSTNRFKKSDNPFQEIQKEGDRLLDARSEYINKCIEIYKNKDKLPLCKYDPEYTDCKFLVNDKIDENTLSNVQKYDSEFSYYAIGDIDNYYNYYFSLLGNLNLLNDKDDPYTQEFFQIISDIIDKRIIVEAIDVLDMKRNFMKLFNDNVTKLFKLYSNDKFNTKEHIDKEFNMFEQKIHKFIQDAQTNFNKDITTKFNELNLGEEALENAGGIYTDNNEYRRIYDYIKSIYTVDNENEDDAPNEIIAQLSTMYTYIKKYGDGSNNPYKDLKTEDDKYIYLTLVIEEAKKITDFWDKILDLYEHGNMEYCIDELKNLSVRFDDYASWPQPSEITINNIEYKHYLFENVYPKEFDDTVDISIGDYDFPEEIEFPEIPDHIDVDENWAIDQLNSHEMGEPDNPNAITFLDFKYWQKYFALATLICLVPSFWNCGLDIMPFIQMIPLPCIFIAISSVYIPMFNMLIVFGIAIRGMYPWPIILYLNTSNQPINILTPLVAILDQLKDAFYSKLGQIEQIPIQGLANFYINKLNNEINEIKKENIKLDTYKTVIKSITLPKGMKLKEEFAKTVNQNVDTRQLITRIETLSKKKKLKRDANQNSVEQPNMQNIMTGVSSVLNPQTEK